MKVSRGRAQESVADSCAHSGPRPTALQHCFPQFPELLRVKTMSSFLLLYLLGKPGTEFTSQFVAFRKCCDRTLGASPGPKAVVLLKVRCVIPL